MHAPSGGDYNKINSDCASTLIFFRVMAFTVTRVQLELPVLVTSPFNILKN